MITRICADDWRDWRTLRIRALTEAPEAFVPTLESIDDRESVWRGRIEAALGCWLAYDGADPVGMVAADPMPDGRLQLASMFVAEPARGAGVGAALIAAVTATAGDRPLYLRVVPGNVAARSVYERAGFVVDVADPDCDGCLAMTYSPHHS
ncbi:MAG TPA: GNAT family N-acetyltransferase [Aeromicrobium sp.]|nr:GNAT family N-acetyltransferase [Aeromicrobium sp.]